MTIGQMVVMMGSKYERVLQALTADPAHLHVLMIQYL